MKLLEFTRNPTYLEKIIVFIGIFVVLFGYALMQKMLIAQGFLLSWDLIQAIFLWLLLVIFLVLLAIAENIKEELLIKHTQELKLIKKEIGKISKKRK